MEEITLKARVRKEGEKRGENSREIPAVIYGKKIESIALFVNLSELNRVYKEAGESTIVNLEVEDAKGKSTSYKTLIYDYQTASIGNEFLHVDFFNVEMDKKIETNIDLEFIGESPAVKALGGTFVTGLDSIEIQCLPSDLPEKIEIDISIIDSFDKHIYVKDVKVDKDVVVLTDENVVIASVSAPRTQEDVENLSDAVDSDISQVEGMAETPGEIAAATAAAVAKAKDKKDKK